MLKRIKWFDIIVHLLEGKYFIYIWNEPVNVLEKTTCSSPL